METRRQEEVAHAWDVVFHSGYVPVQTLLGTCCWDLDWPIRHRQPALFNQVVFEDLMHVGVWSLAGMHKTEPLREVTRTRLLRDLTHGGGRWRSCCNAWVSGRWTIGRRAFLRLSCGRVHRSHGRHGGPGRCLRTSKGVHGTLARWAGVTHSFIDTGCWTGRKVWRKRGDLYAVHSWLHGRRTCTFELASGKGTGREKDGETFSSKLGRGSAPLGASAGSSRVCSTGKPSRPLPSKTDAPLRQPLDPVEVLAELVSVLDRFRSGRSLKEMFGANPGTAPTEAQYIEVLIGSGSGEGGLQRLGRLAHVQRSPRTRHECHEKKVRKDLMTLLREYCVRQQHLHHHCGHLRTLRRVGARVARLLDEVKSDFMMLSPSQHRARARRFPAKPERVAYVLCIAFPFFR